MSSPDAISRCLFLSVGESLAVDIYVKRLGV